MKPTGDYRIDLGGRNEMRRSEAEGRSPKAIAKRRASARAGHRRIACPESSARELGRPRGNAPKSGARREPSAQAEPEGRASGCAKAKRGVGRGHSSGEAGNDRGAKGLCVKKGCKGHEDKKYIARKGCQRGQSADDAASRKPLVQVERCRRDQSETILKRFGERER